MSTSTAVYHGITITVVRRPAGNPLRAECLCGWASEILASRPAAAAAGQVHTSRLPSSVPTQTSHCSCGRTAREVLDGGTYGPTAYCGAAGTPLDLCDCGQGAEQHDRRVCHIYGRGLVQAAAAAGREEATRT